MLRYNAEKAVPKGRLFWRADIEKRLYLGVCGTFGRCAKKYTTWNTDFCYFSLGNLHILLAAFTLPFRTPLQKVKRFWPNFFAAFCVPSCILLGTLFTADFEGAQKPQRSSMPYVP